MAERLNISGQHNEWAEVELLLWPEALCEYWKQGHVEKASLWVAASLWAGSSVPFPLGKILSLNMRSQQTSWVTPAF